MQNSPHSKIVKTIIPLSWCIVIGALVYLGGDAYQAIGLAGLGALHVILGYLLGIILFLALAVLLQRLIQFVLLDWLVASAIGAAPPRLLSQLSSLVIYIMAFAAIAGVVFKKDLTVILAASGAAGIVIGMALQNLILDVFAGLALNLDRSVKIGDCIQLLHRDSSTANGRAIEGTVEEISWRTMRIFERRGLNTVIIPNRVVSASVITNYSHPQAYIKTEVLITLSGHVPLERARRILLAAAGEVAPSFTLANAPAVSVMVIEIIHVPRSVRYAVVIYPTFDTRSSARDLVQQRILQHLQVAGIRPADQDVPDAAHLTHLLGNTALFAELTEADLRFVIDGAVLHRVEPETVLVRAGEVATSMYLIVEGLLMAETRRKIGAQSLPKEPLPLGTLTAGIEVLMSDVYDTTVTTKTTSLLVEIDNKLLSRLLIHQPQTAHRLAQNATTLIQQQGMVARSYWQTDEKALQAEIERNLQRGLV
ncbi:MAG: mechanosensitive ion channel [Methylococcaceae bacterium]|nr:MAG: mechanosensitive ion channel [Methylococcaceae bacterium]